MDTFRPWIGSGGWGGCLFFFDFMSRAEVFLSGRCLPLSTHRERNLRVVFVNLYEKGDQSARGLSDILCWCGIIREGAALKNKRRKKATGASFLLHHAVTPFRVFHAENGEFSAALNLGYRSKKYVPLIEGYLNCLGLSSTTRRAFPSLRAINLGSTSSTSTPIPIIPLICPATLAATSRRFCAPA